MSQAIDDLCVKLADGGGCGCPEKAAHTGDEGLDVVAWRDFPDRKAGKLIAFGQCASGEGDWSGKLNELDGRKFVQKWFRQQLLVEPMRFFFVPWRIPSDGWDHESGRPQGHSLIMNMDMRDLPRRANRLPEPIRCVVTSPPYFDVTNYAEDQWLRLWFLGGPPLPTRQKFSRDDRYSAIDQYWILLADM